MDTEGDTEGVEINLILIMFFFATLILIPIILPFGVLIDKEIVDERGVRLIT